MVTTPDKRDGKIFAAHKPIGFSECYVRVKATKAVTSTGVKKQRMHALLIARRQHMLVMAADTLTLRHKDKRKMPTVVTKFRPSRPTPDTSMQITPSEHAQYTTHPSTCGFLTVTATKHH